MLSIARGLLISVAFVLLFSWALQGSTPFQTCIQQDKKESARDQSENYVSAFRARADIYRDCLGDFVRDRKDEILVAFTVILAFSTIFLWVATRDLVRGAEKTAERQLRAYMIADGNGFTAQTGDQKATHHLKATNTGQTPARNVRVSCVTRILDHPVTSAFDFTLPQDNGGALTVGAGKYTLFDADLEGSLTTEEMEEALTPNSAKRIYSYGTISYRDVFGKDRCTEFCFYLVRFQYADGMRTRVAAAEHYNKET